MLNRGSDGIKILQQVKNLNLMKKNDSFLAFIIVCIIFLYIFALDMTSLAEQAEDRGQSN